MKIKKQKTALFIGRFQPIHNGHLFVIKNILKNYNQIKVVIGSSQEDYTLKNPLTKDEREKMIKKVFSQIGLSPKQFKIYSLSDIDTNSIWPKYINSKIGGFDAVVTSSPLTKILFEDSGYKVEENPLLQRKIYSGSEIRKRIIRGKQWSYIVPSSVFVYLQKIDIEKRLKEINSSDNEYIK